MSAPHEPALEATGITKRFLDGEREAVVLRGVDLRLETDDFAALLGPSGSGKSTLLSILGTLLQPTSGQLRIGGVEVTELSNAELLALRNASIGFVFQFHHLLPDLTAQENVALPAAGRNGRLCAEDMGRAEMLLKRVGLGPRTTYRATQLSGGQKQRVAIARALMNRPSIIFADEPTGSLDRASAQQVLELLSEVAATEGTAFLVSTHDANVADVCRRRVEVRDGRVSADQRA